MSLLRANTKLMDAICDALELKHVRSLDLHLSKDTFATVDVTFYPGVNDVAPVTDAVKRYVLTERTP